jgi:hypothetical protein
VLKSILAVIVGIVMVFALVFVTNYILGLLVPDWYPAPGKGTATAGVHFFTLAFSLIYAVIAGYFTGVVAGRRETLHALVVGLILLGLNLAMQLGTTSGAETTAGQPSWYLFGLPIVGLAGLTFGGWLRERQMAEAPPPPIP